jgi:tetratricopeptide (TPR) repeat protein
MCAKIPQKRVAFPMVSSLLVIIIYFFLKKGIATHTALATADSGQSFFQAGFTVKGFLQTLSLGLGYYFEKLAFPLNLHLLPVVPDNPLYFLISILPFLFCGILLLVGQRVEAFLILWIILTLSPSLVILFSKMTPMAERYLYLPSVAFTVLLALLLSRIRQTTIFVLIAVSIIGFYGFSTHSRLKVWQSEKTLWEDTVMKRPDSATAHTNYGRALIEQKNYKAGEEALHLALQQKASPPQQSNIYDLLGLVEMRQKHYHKAEQYFKDALKKNPGNMSSMNNLGVLYLTMAESKKHQDGQQELLSKAATVFEKILVISPHFIQPKFNLALVYMKQKNYEMAEEYFNAVIENDPRGSFASSAIQFLLAIEFEKRSSKS